MKNLGLASVPVPQPGPGVTCTHSLVHPSQHAVRSMRRQHAMSRQPVMQLACHYNTMSDGSHFSGEVLVAVKLRPINPADVFSMMLVYPAFRPTTFPAVPGMEGTLS